MSAQGWQPGDKALVGVEVDDVTRMSGVDTAFVWVQSTRPGLGRSVGVRVSASDLLPVPVPDGDAIERARVVARKAVADEFYAMQGGDPDWADAPEPNAGDDSIGSAVVHALAAAGLLASPVREPGRSEGEVREAVEADVHRKPSLWAEHDQDGEPDWDLSTLTASWDVSFGCRINFGPDPDGVLRVSVHVSDAAKRDGMARLPVTPDDLRQMAVYLNDVAVRSDQVTDTEGSKP